MDDQNLGPKNTEVLRHHLAHVNHKPLVKPRSRTPIYGLKHSPRSATATNHGIPNQGSLEAGVVETDKDSDQNYTEPRESSRAVVILIIILGLYIAGSAAISLITGSRFLSFGLASGRSGEVIAVDIIYLFSGVGLLMRRKEARVAYIFLALVALLLATIGIHKYFQNTGAISVERQQYIASVNQTITQDQNSNVMADKERTHEIQELRIGEQYQLLVLQKERATIYPLVEGYAIGLIPLVFLLKSSVKQEFK